MEVVLNYSEHDVVEAYWKKLSTLSKTIKLSLASKLTESVLEEEVKETSTQETRKAKVVRRSTHAPTDEELENIFSDSCIVSEPSNDADWQDVVKANSGKTIQPIEKWL